MTTMIVEVYEALRAIDVPDDKAKAAARAVSQDMNRETAGLRADIAALRRDMDAGFAGLRKDMDAGFAGLRKDMDASLAGLRKDMDAGFAGLRKDMDTESRSLRAELASVKSDMAVLRWMVGTSVALMLAVLVKLFLA